MAVSDITFLGILVSWGKKLDGCPSSFVDTVNSSKAVGRDITGLWKSGIEIILTSILVGSVIIIYVGGGDEEVREGSSVVQNITVKKRTVWGFIWLYEKMSEKNIFQVGGQTVGKVLVWTDIREDVVLRTVLSDNGKAKAVILGH